MAKKIVKKSKKPQRKSRSYRATDLNYKRAVKMAKRIGEPLAQIVESMIEQFGATGNFNINANK